ncbi:MAG: hypothetical protein R2824_18980 [Saprospiraceae bacterium]|nr:hypothetical protein [Lewinella sp.]
MSETTEFDQLKAIWSEMSNKLDQQKKLTDQLILQMAHEKSSSRLHRIITMESVGVIAVVIFLFILLSRFHYLSNWLQIGGGILSILTFLISLIIGIRIIVQARKIDLIRNSYQQNINYFYNLKKTLRFYKRLSIVLNILLPFFLIPVVFKLFLNKDLLTDPASFGNALLSFALIIPLALYLIIRFYRRQISQVKEAINEIDQ